MIGLFVGVIVVALMVLYAWAAVDIGRRGVKRGDPPISVPDDGSGPRIEIRWTKNPGDKFLQVFGASVCLNGERLNGVRSVSFRIDGKQRGLPVVAMEFMPGQLEILGPVLFDLTDENGTTFVDGCFNVATVDQ
jgi:hypothetical protein